MLLTGDHMESPNGKYSLGVQRNGVLELKCGNVSVAVYGHSEVWV